ncbi:MAG TPA: cache domain-containing protein [Marmoricola sp.]|nr:cache domain-containing protein [Marmoricola sp.]HNO40425.1 cache domain-containing protein [Marmoricola sp.]
MKTTTKQVTKCAQAVEELFHPLIQTLWESGAEIAPLFDQPSSSADLLAISRPFALEILSSPHTVGAGFVATPGLLTDETFLLAWWQGDDKERIPESIALVQSTDYSRQEWFRTPQRTHASHVTGPYIDYVCTDEFMLTVTVPVERNDQMLGVMGADILAETVERILLDQFQQSGATLANHHGRVVLSADPRVFAGEPISPDQYDVQIPCADLPLTVLATTQEPK